MKIKDAAYNTTPIPMSARIAATHPTNPIDVTIVEEDPHKGLRFTLSDTDVSYANSIRRTLLSDIPMVVFKTLPYAESMCTIPTNTSRLHNEIIKQRLSCIPIHISPIHRIYTTLDEYVVEVDVENKTDTLMMVTTEDFKIRHTITDTVLSEEETRNIFPPFMPEPGNPAKKYFIAFVPLNPTLSAELPGEALRLTCGLSIGTARQNSAFNATGTCAFGCTPDVEAARKACDKLAVKWAADGKSPEDIVFEKKNWMLLDGLRVVKDRSFDFAIQTVGVHGNRVLIIMACDLLQSKINEFAANLTAENKVDIHVSDNIMEMSYDVVLEDRFDILGYMLRYEVFKNYYDDREEVSFIGYHKEHPHDSKSLVRIALANPSNEDGPTRIQSILLECCRYMSGHIAEVKDVMMGRMGDIEEINYMADK
jgi:DNA-directed RNA polymerase subunit L